MHNKTLTFAKYLLFYKVYFALQNNDVTHFNNRRKENDRRTEP